MATAQFDIKKLVNSFGGATQLQTLLAQNGFDTSVKTINMWVYRKSISQDGLHKLTILAKKQGREINLSDYVLEDDQPVDDPMDFLE